MTKSLAIIGAGGINSWFIQHLSEVLGTFDKDIFVKIFDDDMVEEKNILRSNQNFTTEDLMEQKEEVLSKRYNFDFESCFITEENIDKKLDNFTDVILGVDNNKTRKLVYEYCHKKGKYLLDLRAQGTQMMFCVLEKDKPINYYLNKYFSNKDLLERKGSCQLESDVEADHIENANKAIAFLGAYCIYFKHIRGETPLMYEYRVAY